MQDATVLTEEGAASQVHPYHAEERVNAATHAAGLACAAVGSVVLLVAAARRGGVWQVAGCGVYAVTLVAAYAASTLSHWVREPRRRRFWRVADQAVIFLFIAGSYTPMALTYLRSGAWWALHAAVWGVAVAGFGSKAVFAHRVGLGAVSAGLYVLLGWMPVLATGPALAVVPGRLLLWVLAGGVAYTAGIVFFHFDDRVRYFHAAWHVLVIVGSACHYLGNLFYCTAAAG